MVNLKQMGEKIKELRIKKGYTQEELAKKLGYTSRSTINKIEKGLIDIPQSKIIDLANLFNCSPVIILNQHEYQTGYSYVNITTTESGCYDYILDQEGTNEVINLLESIKINDNNE